MALTSIRISASWSTEVGEGAEGMKNDEDNQFLCYFASAHFTGLR